jgi:Protein of unknown function (DUF1552)
MIINRREFFKKTALGTTALALAPSFNNLLGASVQSAPVNTGGFPHRFVFIRKSNGNLCEQFGLDSFSSEEKKKHDTKQAFELDLDKHELPDWLKCLDAHKEHMTILHGISMCTSGGGHSSYSGCLGSYKNGNNVLSAIKWATVDFELAKLFPSPYGHVEVSLAASEGKRTGGILPGMSAPGPQQRNYCYADPMTAYNELFKSVTDTQAAESDNSLLNYLFDQETRLLSGLKGEERMKISDQVASLQATRERNDKVAALGDKIKNYLPKIDPIHVDTGIDATMPQKQAALTDVIVAALASGLTNVVTYTIDSLGTAIDTLPENEEKTSIHAVGHGMGGRSDFMRAVMQTYHMKQVETLVTKLKAIPEGSGTMFDNTTIIYFPETGAGHHSPDTEAPMVIMTGKNSRLDIAGRYIRLPFHGTEGHKTLSNWYTTLLNAYGNPIKHYGDLDLVMQRNRLDQMGAIKRFMA